MDCPQCAKEVFVTEDQYLSMYTCSKCQAVYFLDINGNPEFGEMLSEDFQVETEIFNPESQLLENTIVDELISSEISDEINSIQEPFLENFLDEKSAFSQVAAEITDFANQDNSVSLIYYHLNVSGLDSKEILTQFQDALEDSKFGWITQDIFSQIKNGKCEFKNLNPIQAFVLAKRIQFLEVDLKWEQHVQI